MRWSFFPCTYVIQELLRVVLAVEVLSVSLCRRTSGGGQHTASATNQPRTASPQALPLGPLIGWERQNGT